MMLNSVKFAEEFFANFDNAWIRLDIDFDVSSAVHEISKIDKFYVDHRDGEDHTGWTSCCLHGIEIDKTLGWENYTSNEQLIDYKWTKLTEYTPSITEFWKNVFPVESYKRLRFMKLDSAGYIKKHRDHDPSHLANYDIFSDGIAVNLAITHPSQCTMTFEDTNIVPWTPGSAFMLNVSKYHAVVNNSNLPRVHMIAHAVIGDKKQEFCDLLYRSYKKYHA